MKRTRVKNFISYVCAAAIICSLIQSAPTARAGNTGAVFMNPTTACGESYSAAVTEDGTLYMWGYNNSDYLGVNNGGADVVKPAEVMQDVDSVYVSSESYPICAAVIKNDGTLWTWGDNTFGRLGNGNETSTATPQKIMDNAAAAAVGFKHAAAIKKDGTLWTWGLNNYGQLGDGTKDNRSEPKKIMDNVVSVSAGYWHTAAVTSDGKLWTWGCNRYNELGDGTVETRLEPVKVMDDVVWAQACGEMTAAIKKDGTVWTCGTNNNHELGHSEDKRSADFNQIPGLEKVKFISLGYRYGLAVTESGEMYGWGCGGALGDGKILEQTPLTKITDNVNSVAAGYDHSLVLKEDGTLFSCGTNFFGQLGDGNHETNTRTLVHTLIEGIDNVKLVSKKPIPTATPTVEPTAAPTATPTVEPTTAPTVEPTVTPTAMPTVEPTTAPTVEPTVTPTAAPTTEPMRKTPVEITYSNEEKTLLLKSYDSKIKSAEVIHAGYDENGALIGIKMYSVNFGEGGEAKIENTEIHKNEKIFVWSEISGDGALMPLSEVYICKITELPKEQLLREFC